MKPCIFKGLIASFATHDFQAPSQSIPGPIGSRILPKTAVVRFIAIGRSNVYSAMHFQLTVGVFFRFVKIKNQPWCLKIFFNNE